MMKSRGISLTAAAMLSAFALGGCSAPTDVTWQANGMPRHDHPSQEWWHYKFIYHPNAQVYFEPYTQRYFWFQDGAWREGHSLPGEVTLEGRLAQVVNLREEQPSGQHQTVMAWHPCLRELPARFDPSSEAQIWLAGVEQDGQ